MFRLPEGQFLSPPGLENDFFAAAKGHSRS
jgi:hypothetical protein